MYLFRLTYYSKNAISNEKRSIFKEIKSILDVAAKNNLKIGVSGALLFNQNYFAQILEGDRKAVTDVFCRISGDPRHSDLVILDAKPVTERLFLEWSMAFAGHSDVADELYMRYGIRNGFDPARMTSDALVKFMVELCKHEEHLAKPTQTKAA